jgi:hypothetical protein
MLRTAKAGLRLLPALARDPKLLLRWLVDARAAQVAAVLFLLFASFGLPVTLEQLERLYPPVQSQNVWGRLFRVERTHPLLEARRRQLTVLTWLGGAAGITMLLLRALPRAVSAADERARELEADGDSRTAAAPTESLAHASANPDTDLRALRAAETAIAPQPLTGPPESVGIEQRYRIVKELGRGGMGVVYQAFDSVLERELALKELALHLTAQGDFARRFKQEARVLARLSHPHIVLVHDLVEQGERIWIAMELVKGGTLAGAIERAGGPLPWRRALQLGEQICLGLDYAHGQGVIHRDVKPMNVLLTHEETGSAKLTDFGLAKHVGASTHTREGTLLGSVRYMSPEQAAGRKADALSDVYSFGITLYEMLTGRVPFDGETPTVLAQHISQPPTRLRRLRPELPERLEIVVHRLLAKRPEQRPKSLRLVAEALAILAGDDSDRRAGEPRA